MASTIRALKRSTRLSLMSCVDGKCISGILLLVVRSIELSKRRSRGVTNRMAFPSRPARPVRPIRCTYDSLSCGMS